MIVIEHELIISDQKAGIWQFQEFVSAGIVSVVSEVQRTISFQGNMTFIV